MSFGVVAEPQTAPASADAVFGERVDLARSYAARLASTGIERGLVGPREVTRLWDRHLLNSAIVTDLLPADARLVDVGTGAGLPGVPMAIRRPDLTVDLVEPMQRRVDFLVEVLADLGLRDRVRVWRGRADDAPIVDSVGKGDWVVARAVAPLDRLVRWCLPLLAPGGRLLAVKGARAAEEVARSREALRELWVHSVEVRELGVGVLETPTRVVLVGAGSRKGRGGSR